MKVWSKVVLGGFVAAALSPAMALDTVTFTGDANLGDFLVAGSEEAVAELRYGNGALNGDWEIGAGANTQAVGLFDQDQFSWSNGATESFSLIWDGSTLDLMLGGASTSYALAGIGVDDVLIRTASSVGNAISVSNLVVNGDTVGIDVGVLDGDSDASYLGLLNEFGAPFTLTGDVSFAWSDAASLRGSRPSVQFKIGTVVPEPGSFVLIGFLGLLAWRR